jgi:uncharacterized alpha-E superfamily protein
MLSRVADSLYWMSRYFERAENCARVLEATHNVMINTSKISTGQRWYRALQFLGMPIDSASEELDSQQAMLRLAVDRENSSSVVSCITAARDNSSQVREEISSDMWEQLNRLFHEVTQWRPEDEADVLRMLTMVRQGSYTFHGVTYATMSHGEGWFFLQLGQFTERACALSLLLDAYFSTETPAGDLDWLALLTSCAALEAYSKAYTADLQPERVAEFVLLRPEFPYSVRFAVERMHDALYAIMERSSTPQNAAIERIAGKLRASVAYVQISEVMESDLHLYLSAIIEQCRNLHKALHDAFIDYPIEAALEN